VIAAPRSYERDRVGDEQPDGHGVLSFAKLAYAVHIFSFIG
jgi:hypothetical protein